MMMKTMMMMKVFLDTFCLEGISSFLLFPDTFHIQGILSFRLFPDTFGKGWMGKWLEGQKVRRLEGWKVGRL